MTEQRNNSLIVAGRIRKPEIPSKPVKELPPAPVVTPPTVIVAPPRLADDVERSKGTHLIVSKGLVWLSNFHVKSTASGTLWVHLFDTHDPREGLPPARAWELPAGYALDYDWPHGRPCGNGCSLWLSSTENTLTKTTDEALFDAVIFRNAVPGV